MDINTINLDLNIELFICPLTNQIFNDPVIAEDGQLYERSAIEQWFSENKISPLSRKVIHTTLVESYTIKNILDSLLKKNPDLKLQQFKLDNSHQMNVNTIIKLINSGQYNKLLNYAKFDFNIFMKNTIVFGGLLSQAPNDILKYVIDNTIDIDCKNKIGTKPIHLICNNCNYDIIKYVFEKGADFELEDDSKWRPIHHLCYNSRDDIIEYLIKNKIDLNCKTNFGWLPIHAACHYCSLRTIILFAITGIGLNEKINNYTGQTCSYTCSDLLKKNRKLNSVKLSDIEDIKNLLGSIDNMSNNVILSNAMKAIDETKLRFREKI